MIFTFLFLLLGSQPASAEYRAYELIITNQISGISRNVTSTLDHIQYGQYYPLALNEVIQYSTSWMCWGRTGNFKKICPNPAESIAQPRPNSTP